MVTAVRFVPDRRFPYDRSEDYPSVRKVIAKKDKSIFADTCGIEGQFLAIVECKCEKTLIDVNYDDFALDQPMEQRWRTTKHVP